MIRRRNPLRFSTYLVFFASILTKQISCTVRIKTIVGHNISFKFQLSIFCFSPVGTEIQAKKS